MALQTPKPGATAPAASAPPPVSLAARAAALGFESNHSDEEKLSLGVGLWGQPMSVKTTHALSFPNPVVFNFDNTTTSITAQKKAIPYIQVRTVAQMKALAQAAANRELSALVQTMPGFEDYKVETVVTDSSTAQAGDVVDPHLATQTFRDKWAMFDAKLLILREYYNLMRKAREWQPGKEQYWHVVIMHERIRLNEKGEVTGITADISGDYARLIFQQNDVNLLCERMMPEVADQKTGKLVAGPKPVAVVHSVPPTKWHVPVGDRVGGYGRFGTLPNKMIVPPNDKGGLWSILEEHWMGASK